MPRRTRSGASSPVGFGGGEPGSRSSVNAIFRKEGEYWTVGVSNRTFQLKHTKGFDYLAHLLRYPGIEFHVLDLAGGIGSPRDHDETSQSVQNLPSGDENLEKAGIHVSNLGDAGEMLDEQAKSAYRHRLSELRDDLDGAKAANNIDRAERIEQEIDALTKELSRAVGLGGRNRRAASASERARQTVSKSIKSVLERIAQNDAALGDTLARCIKTGTFCAYQPDPDFPIAWEFASTSDEPPEPPTASGDSTPARAERPQSQPSASEVSPFPLAQRTAFVGRESEASAIRAAIDRASTGHGSIVMLWDGPGVGKTRLAMEMTEYASSKGFRCSVGHCYERDEPVPYFPIIEIIENNVARAASLEDFRRRMGDTLTELVQIAPSLRRVFPDLPKPLELPPAQQRGYLFQSFSEALARAARIRPQILVLEDLHWADESTLALLTHLANRVVQFPALIIGTYRSGYSETNPALVRTLEELIRMGVRPLKLRGLSEDGVGQMLRVLSRREAPESLMHLIYGESQGYPFFVEEVYRHLVDAGKVFDAAGQFLADIAIDENDVPENVRLIISRRLERFDENEKRAVTAAAVIGRSFSFQLLAGVSQIDVDELFAVIEKAQQLGIVVPSSEGPERPFTFRHELVRQTVLAAISAPRRQRMHASVAETIERRDPDAVHERAGEIVDHLIKAGSFAEPQKLVRWLTQAGSNALDAAAFEDARRNFRSALSNQGAVEARERAGLLARLAMAERGLDQWDAAIAHQREALEIYMNLDDLKMIGRSFSQLATFSIWAGRFREAIETARHGLTCLQAEPGADRARLLAILAQALAAGGVYQPANEALREALNIASQLSDPKLEAGLLSVQSTINIQFFRVREIVTNGLLSKRPRGSDLAPWQSVLQLLIQHQVLLYLGRLEEALRVADELEPVARKIGQTLSVAFCVSTRASIEFGKAPDLAKLEAAFQGVRESGREASFAHLTVFFEAQLGLVDFFRGNWTSALLHAQAARRLELGTSMEGFGVGTLFRHLTYAGDRDSALAILDEKRTLLPRRSQTNTAGAWLLLALVIEGLVTLGEHSQAGQLYPVLCELIGTGPVVLWPIFRFTQTIAGVAAAAARQWEAAEEHFQIALQQAESFTNRLEQAEIRRFHAMMLLDRAAPADREGAQELLTKALASYTQIGMPRYIEITQALLDKT